VAGVDGRRVVFLVPDAALGTSEAEATLADINTLLNTGDVMGGH
jgi:hypothetical protein